MRRYGQDFPSWEFHSAPGLRLYFRREFYVRLVASGDLLRDSKSLFCCTAEPRVESTCWWLQSPQPRTRLFFSPCLHHSPQIPRLWRGAALLSPGGTRSPSISNINCNSQDRPRVPLARLVSMLIYVNAPELLPLGEVKLGTHEHRCPNFCGGTASGSASPQLCDLEELPVSPFPQLHI